MKVKNKTQLCNQDSGNVEWWTRADVIESARATMGSIDLDPASCEGANEKFVHATKYFTEADDGLKQTWYGNVWMNHPYSPGEQPCKPNCKKEKCKKRGHCITEPIPPNAEWLNKLISEYEQGHIKQACCIVNASTSEAWFQPLYAYPICFIARRYRFYPGAGQKNGTPGKGSCVVYLGTEVKRFRDGLPHWVESCCRTGIRI